MTKTASESPCIGICTLDVADICVGCGRSLAEIARWREMTADEQRRVVEIGRQRLAIKNASSGGESV